MVDCSQFVIFVLIVFMYFILLYNMKLVSVYGSSFTSDEFQFYVKFNGIVHWRTAP